jgi:hypothetical protein
MRLSEVPENNRVPKEALALVDAICNGSLLCPCNASVVFNRDCLRGSMLVVILE